MFLFPDNTVPAGTLRENTEKFDFMYNPPSSPESCSSFSISRLSLVNTEPCPRLLGVRDVNTAVCVDRTSFALLMSSSYCGTATPSADIVFSRQLLNVSLNVSTLLGMAFGSSLGSDVSSIVGPYPDIRKNTYADMTNETTKMIT